jgi:hypothetical protein
MKATLSIINNGSVTINPYSYEVAGKDLAQAVGKALYEAHMKLSGNRQWDNPIVSINEVELTDAQVKKVRSSFINFQLDFGVVRENVLAQLAFTSEEAGVSYIRHTDRNGIFAKQKTFTAQQIAAQAKEQIKLTRFVTSLVKEDAKASVYPPEVAQAMQLKADAARQKRIAAKTSK